MLRSVALRGCLRAGGSGEDEKLTVREDAVYIEKEELDFTGTGLRGRLPGH